MIEYTTALLLILITFIVSMINIKFSLFSYIIVIIDAFVLVPDLIINNGLVIVGYNLVGSNLVPLTVSYSWLRIVTILAILLCIVTAMIKETGGFGNG